MTSLSVLLRFEGPEPLGGIICQSGILTLDKKHFKQSLQAKTAQSNTPLLLMNGDQDYMVDYIDAVHSFNYLKYNLYIDNKDNYK